MAIFQLSLNEKYLVKGVIRIMEFKFKRENRGSSSDVYAIIDCKDDSIKGRLDIHFFSNGIIEGLVVYTEELSQQRELSLIEQIDSELVPQAIIDDKNFSITFVTSSDIKVFGKD
tara:strand:- start:999 stop:1343 length:345 start_codon:yes stop_codon:yes gene_type:complete